MTNNIPDLQEKFQHLQEQILDLDSRNFYSKERLQSLSKDIASAKSILFNVQEDYKVKYTGLTEICCQIQKLENHIERFKNSHNYQEIEQITTHKVKG